MQIRAELRLRREAAAAVNVGAVRAPEPEELPSDAKRQRRFEQPQSHELAGELLRSSVNIERLSGAARAVLQSATELKPKEVWKPRAQLLSNAL